MEKHTALPWQANGWSIFGNGNHPVAEMIVGGRTEATANVHYIVTACNVYPALVEALERVENDCHKAANGGLTTASSKVTVKELTILLRDIRDYTHTALALAKGEQC